MLTDKDGKPLVAGDPTSDEGALAMVYTSAPKEGLTGPPVEQFRITATGPGFEIRVANEDRRAIISRANLVQFIANMMEMMLEDQRRILRALAAEEVAMGPPGGHNA